MSTVAANTQTTVALTPGQQMTVRGNGMAFYGPGPLNAQPVTILNVATFGPFADRSQAVTLLAGPSGMTYNVFNGSAVPARATVGASGASDGGLMSPDGDPIIQIPPQPDLATLNANYPAASNAGKSALAGPVNAKQPLVSNGGQWTEQGAQAAQRYRVIGGHVCAPTAGSAGSDYSGSSRLRFWAQDPFNELVTTWDAGSAAATITGTEAQQLSPQIYRASVEYPPGTTPRWMSVNGKTTWVQYPGAAPIWTSVQGLAYPGGSVDGFMQVFQRVAKPPTIGTATAGSGGQLAAATYYVKVTTVDQGVESGPSGEVSAAVSANGSLAVTWTNPTYCDAVNVYIGTSTNTETFLMQVVGGRQGVVIYDLVGQTSAPVPTTQHTLLLSRYLLNGESASVQPLTASDHTGTSGAVPGQAGPYANWAPAPSLILANTATDTAIGGMHDSIGNGSGMNNGNGAGVMWASHFGNWFARACINAGKSWFNHSRPGAMISQITGNTGPSNARLAKLLMGKHFICNLGTNDMANGRTGPQIAADHIALAKIRYAAGKNYTPCTILPRVTTTDACLTIANQTKSAFEATRIWFNTWLRNGFLVDGSGTPVLTGGTPSPYITNYFDGCLTVEVDATNTLVLNGGYWLVPTAPELTGTFAGTPTTTALSVTGTPLTAPSGSSNGAVLCVVKITSGAQAGSVFCVSANTTSAFTAYANGNTSFTGVALVGLASAPAAGDTWELWRTQTLEGLHPSQGHITIGTALQTWLGANT